MSADQKKYANCPQCSYSVTPDEILTVRKHFDAHSLRCVRCGYTTETMASWAEAARAWNKGSAARNADRVAQSASANPKTGGTDAR